MSAEEIGFLAGGPGRAAGAALARLMDGGLVSGEGHMTAVHQNHHGRKKSHSDGGGRSSGSSS